MTIFTTLVLHGLNQRPERMDAITQLVRNRSSELIRVELLGHAVGESWDKVTAEHWLQQIQDKVTDAEKLKKPILCLGYSIGGLLCYLIAQTNPHIHSLLFAPALFPHSALRWLPTSDWFAGFPIPSSAAKEFRVHGSTPIRAYRALLEIADRSLQLAKPKGRGLVFMDPLDEAVSFEKVRGRLPESWSLQKVTATPHHLVVEPTRLKKENWQFIQSEIQNFFSLPAPW